MNPKILRRIGPCWLALLLAMTPVLAKTVHVRVDGDDTACNGTANAPSSSAPSCAYATPQKGAGTLVAGDTLLIHGGTYTSCPSNTDGRTAVISLVLKNGSASSPITIKGAGDGPVSFPGGSGCGYAVYLRDASYVTVGGTGTQEGFQIGGQFTMNADPNQTLCGIFFNRYGQNVKALGHTFAGSTSVSSSSGDTSEIAFWGNNAGLNAEIAYNTINCKNTEDCIAIGTWIGCGDDGPCITTNAQIHHNIVTEGVGRRHLAIRSRGSGAVSVFNNYINLGRPGSPTHSDSSAIQSRDNRDWQVYNNYFYVYGAINSYALQYYDYNMGAVPERHQTWNNTFYGYGMIAINERNCTDCVTRNNLIIGYSSSNKWERGQDCSASGTTGGAHGHAMMWNVSYRWNTSSTCSAACPSSNCDADSTNLYQDPLITGTGTLPVPVIRGS